MPKSVLILVAYVLMHCGFTTSVQAFQPGDVVAQLQFPGCCPMGATYDGEALWVSDRKVNKIFRISTRTGQVLAEIPTPGIRPTGMTWDGRYLWVADRDNQELFRLDPRTAIVDRTFRISVRAPRGLAWDGECIYMASAKNDVIYCLDPDDGTIMRKIRAPDNAVTGLTFDGKHLWAADRSWDELYMLDPKEGHVIGILKSPGPHPFGLAFDGQHIWNVDYQTRKIYAININQGDFKRNLGERNLQVEYVIHFQNQGPDPIREANFFVAVPKDRYHQEIVGVPTFSKHPIGMLEDRWKQRIAHFREKNIPAGKHLAYSMSLSAKLKHTRFWIVPEKVKPLGTISKKIRLAYLGNNTKYRIMDPVVREAVKKSVGSETNPYWIARKLYQFVLEKLDYKLSGGWDSVPLLLERGTGSCSEYAFVLIALCRAAGVPARWVGGIATRGDDAFVDNVFHRWAEIYLPGYGWIPVDPDRGDKTTPRNQALGFGNLENTLLVTTVSGGESEYLGWKYNGDVQWSFKGRNRAYVEHIGELAPVTPADDPASELPELIDSEVPVSQSPIMVGPKQPDQKPSSKTESNQKRPAAPAEKKQP